MTPKPLVMNHSMFWRIDPVVEDARKRDGWRDFHRACGDAGVYFDDIGKTGRAYQAIAFRVDPKRSTFLRFALADGRGPGPIDALVDAYRKCGTEIPAAETAVLRMLGLATTETTEFDDLIGPSGSQDSYEDLIG